MRVLKSYGTQGEVILGISSDCPKDINLTEPVFICFDELPVPFFIESVKEKGGTRLLVKFEDIDTLSEAEELVGRDVSFSDETTVEGLQQHALVGILVFDQNGNRIGPITDFNDYSGNTCITVDSNGKEVILPYNEKLVIKLKKNSLYLEIPEGLI